MPLSRPGGVEPPEDDLLKWNTSNLYRAVMQCARASTRHNQLRTDTGPRLANAYGCGTRIYPRTGAILFAYVPTSFVE